MGFIRLLKDWTLPFAIATGTIVYLSFYFVPAFDEIGNRLSPIIDKVFPFFVFFTLLVTFCKVDFHQMRLHRWHLWVILAQIILLTINIGLIFLAHNDLEQKILWEGVLTCVIAPSAAAAPVVTGKLGGNISTMTTFTILSALVSAILIPAIFPLLEPSIQVSFVQAFFMILQNVASVLVLPLILGYLLRHCAKKLHKWIISQPNLAFYSWGISLSITTGITVKNIVHSNCSFTLLLLIAIASLLMCFVQFGIGRCIGKKYGEHINAGQALFQKNTSLAIWVSYMYLNPIASIGAGCYVLWQNIINSIELWDYQKNHKAINEYLK